MMPGHSVPTAMPLGVSRMEEAGRAVAEERNVPTSPPGVTSSLQPDITTAASATFVAMPTGTDCRLDCAKLPVLVTEVSWCFGRRTIVDHCGIPAMIAEHRPIAGVFAMLVFPFCHSCLR